MFETATQKWLEKESTVVMCFFVIVLLTPGNLLSREKTKNLGKKRKIILA